ncbi:hypothetical protein ACIA5G_45250 [Amycolatopsis sp. NPDC051758]|uniref:hypothetical protein n=1 Tax=Amycolatopsis sp. NPDC051758 TaxID=3363935 RepID=UPI00379D5DC1
MRREPRDAAVLVVIKVVHTTAWFAIESCFSYVLYSGLAKRSDRRAALAGGVVALECLVFAANGFRCPLTEVAASFGADHGSVTDIFLPPWFARNLPVIHVPLLVLAVGLHVRNLRHGRAINRRCAAGPARRSPSGSRPPRRRVRRGPGVPP